MSQSQYMLLRLEIIRIKVHFNRAGGSDLIIGYKEHRNSFDVGEGEKTFLAGIKKIRFI